jgi:hypothetical protein
MAATRVTDVGKPVVIAVDPQSGGSEPGGEAAATVAAEGAAPTA